MKPLRVLVACEFSGVVRNAFRALGHDAYSCDLLPSADDSPWHIQGDVLPILSEGWSMMVAHPPCTHLAVSGARWFKDKQVEQAEALEFVRVLLQAPIAHIALENPVSVISSRIRKPDQIIQPWMFGHGETKATCLWLKGLPELQATNVVEGREGRVWKLPPSPDRWKLRSIHLAWCRKRIRPSVGWLRRQPRQPSHHTHGGSMTSALARTITVRHDSLVVTEAYIAPWPDSTADEPETHYVSEYKRLRPDGTRRERLTAWLLGPWKTCKRIHSRNEADARDAHGILCATYLT